MGTDGGNDRGGVVAVAFDAYGTVFDTGTGSLDAVSSILQRIGPRLDAREFYAKWKQEHVRLCRSERRFAVEAVVFERGLASMYERYGLNGDPATDVKAMLSTLGRRQPFPDAPEAIDWVRRRWTTVIASNSDTQPLESDVARAGLRVDVIYTSEMALAYKPAAQFYEALAKRLACLPQQVVFVGDSVDEDVLAPIHHGMHGIWLNRRGLPAAEGVLRTIRSLSSLPEVLAELRTA